jgi:UDP-N-acetylmuramate-alanine ligase
MEFQDFVVDQLYKAGIPIVMHTSKKKQFLGENKLGIEIKHDKMMEKTGNVYIEYEEKSNPNNAYFVKSGILRDDNSWLWAIANNKVIYIVSKRVLRQIYEKRPEYAVFTGNKTSKGFLLNIELIEKIAEKIIRIELQGVKP